MMKRFTLTVASLLMGMTAVMAQNTKVDGYDCGNGSKHQGDRSSFG